MPSVINPFYLQKTCAIINLRLVLIGGKITQGAYYLKKLRRKKIFLSQFNNNLNKQPPDFSLEFKEKKDGTNNTSFKIQR